MATNFLTNLVSSYEGADATDEHGPNDLTNVGTGFTAGELFGTCFDHDGIADTLDISDASQVGMDAGTGSMSQGIWVKPRAGSLGGAGKFLIGKRGGGGAHDQGYQLDLSSVAAGKVRAYISDGVTAVSVASTTTLVAGSIYLLGMTVNRTTQKLQLTVNGVQEGGDVDCSAVGSLSNADAFAIGYFSFLVSNFYDGFSDMGRLWIGRAITVAEWLEMYNGGAAIAYSALGGSTGGENNLPFWGRRRTRR